MSKAIALLILAFSAAFMAPMWIAADELIKPVSAPRTEIVQTINE